MFNFKQSESNMLKMFLVRMLYIISQTYYVSLKETAEVPFIMFLSPSDTSHVDFKVSQ